MSLIETPINENEFLAKLRGIADEMLKAAEIIDQAAKRPVFSWNEQEAAEILGISFVTLQRTRRAGRIGYTPVAGRARYTKKQMQDFLERQAVNAAK